MNKKINNCFDSPLDTRDFLYCDEVSGSTLSDLPVYFRLNCSPIRDQKGLGCCVGEGGATALECDRLTEGDNNLLSELFLYAQCKEIDNLPNTQGTYLRCLMKVLKNIGCAKLSDYPFYDDYDTRHNIFPEVSEELLADAATRRIKKYARIYSLNELKKAIYNENGVIASLRVTDSFYEPQNGVIGGYYGNDYGNHCIAIIGWDDNKTCEYDYSKLDPKTIRNKTSYTGCFIAKNSWGKNWGDQGYFYIPYKIFDLSRNTEDRDLFREAWTTVHEKSEVHNPEYHINNSSIYMEFTLNDNQYRVNGVEKEMDIIPIVKNERTLVPIRVIAEELGCNVEWKQDTQTAVITKDNIKAEIPINSKYVYVNGLLIELDTASVVINERILVPIRFVAETFGCTVHWEQESQKITILKNNTDV